MSAWTESPPTSAQGVAKETRALQPKQPMPPAVQNVPMANDMYTHARARWVCMCSSLDESQQTSGMHMWLLPAPFASPSPVSAPLPAGGGGLGGRGRPPQRPLPAVRRVLSGGPSGSTLRLLCKLHHCLLINTIV